MNVLVTAIAGDIGNGVGRILKSCEFLGKLIGCDIHDEHMGAYVFDHCAIVPRASANGYIEALRSLVERHCIDAVVVTSEPELRLFSDIANKGQKVDLPLVLANQMAMVIGFDKLKTAEFIASIGCAAPWTIAIEKGDPKTFPCILKQRFGAGGQGVFIVKEPGLIKPYRAIFNDYVWQEFIPDDNNEYTCGVYGCADGEIRTIVFRRRLVSGVTGYAELVENRGIDALCRKIASALNLKGSINIQLRTSVSGSLVFEINPRFSSTVVFRHKLGFTDLLWSIQEQIQGNTISSYSIGFPAGSKMYRTFDEIIRSAADV